MTTPYTVLSCAVSLDGYLDTAAPPRLILSNAADLDRVDEVRSTSDAILVGARTVRLDNPRLLVRSAARRARRLAEGSPATPLKVTVTRSGDLDPDAAFFADDGARKLVYCPGSETSRIRRLLGRRAAVVGLGRTVAPRALAADLADRGVERLMVEGGGTTLRQFLAGGVADELHLAVAPIFVGDPAAPRFLGPGPAPWGDPGRATPIDSTPIGDVVLLRYALSARADIRPKPMAAAAQHRS
ncbi:RibD family protein [Frondihabitans australicus]|uniref:5-amino-6-(5-phosphoribosylamino)uracil reductase n=1 Tax=Frondihabitans australicus TaxID=386892 RepID=A0A495IJE2_9MICO|nr:dihydrofolate reductase family protein [Frondihabitans australicus]RKR75245.1 5-amino-6-(5-phosphoribosylamino)uracil reductase [Frondihabitans australicus]